MALLEATADLCRERNLGLKMACVRIRFCRNTEERQRSLRPLSLLHLPPARTSIPGEKELAGLSPSSFRSPKMEETPAFYAQQGACAFPIIVRGFPR